MIKKFLLLIILTFGLLTTMLLFTRTNVQVAEQELELDDSRNRMSFDNKILVPPPGINFSSAEESNIIPPDLSQTKKLKDALPIRTEYFEISIGEGDMITVVTLGSNYRHSMLEFYSWLEREGYGNIDSSTITINQ